MSERKAPSVYKDEELKQKAYREKIMKSIAATGVYPSLSLVEQQLDDIDLKLSMFTYRYKQKGTTFDVERYNTEMQDIYKDISILYQVVQELSIKEYNELKDYANRELDYLEQKSKECLNRAELEITTDLGNTIYYAANGFNQQYINGRVEIDLGAIKTHAGRTLSCILEGTDLDLSQTIFDINGSQISPYGYNQDTLKLSGDTSYQAYTFIINKDQKLSGSIPLQSDSFKPDERHSYRILSGRNKIRFRTSSYKTSYIDISNNSSFAEDTEGIYTFYILNGTYASFEYSNRPVQTNFIGDTITSMPFIQKIEITANANTAIELHTDGIVYAHNPDYYIKNDVLYAVNPVEECNDYIVEEKKDSAEISLPAKVIIKEADRPYYDITQIAIKESEELV